MNVGERVKITGKAGSATLVIHTITGLFEAERHAVDKGFMRMVCTFAYNMFGENTKILWLADEQRPLIKDNLVDGFPVLLTPENEMIGLDGERLSFQVQ